MITALLSVLVPLVSAATPPRIEVEMFPQTAIVGDPINIVLNPSKDIAMVESSWLLVKGNAKDLRVGKKVRVEKRKDGSVKVAHTFRAPGKYTLFASFKMADGAKRVFPLAVEVK